MIEAVAALIGALIPLSVFAFTVAKSFRADVNRIYDKIENLRANELKHLDEKVDGLCGDVREIWVRIEKLENNRH